ncbi:PAS domain S-box protein [Candidatus Nomurabacteria bacterium]|nr:PAS domain S-box protein [Candidatus Kaiserbacteria bacterium]MCB9814423.1 PAS domain S-box protein [Candidatus Nomurabacteria bacterium]
MYSSKVFTFLRILELILIFLLIVVVLGSVWLLHGGSYSDSRLYQGAGLIVFLLFLLLFIRIKLDAWYATLSQKSEFSDSQVFDSLYERSPVAYITMDVSGAIVNFNPAAVNLLQTTADTMGQVNFYQRVSSDTGMDVSVLQQKISAGLTINDEEVLLQSARGENIWVMLSVYNHRNKQQRLVSLVDITEQKNVDTAKSEFVALATHQLRTPIAAIRWNVELLQRNMRETVTPDQTRYLKKIERNVMRMISLINDFLSVSKLEMGTFSTRIEEVNLSEFFDSALDEFQEKITEKKLKIERSDEPPQAYIKTDTRLFHIIVSNLVSNAVKYILPEGTLTLTYDLRSNTLRIVVADTGIGIPAEELDKMFVKFFRASNAQAHQTEGTGLGLYVVKQSVEILKGNITVESEENVGTKFVVTLPVEVLDTRSLA